MNHRSAVLWVQLTVLLPTDAASTTWSVGHSGSEDFASIREACEAAAAGDSLRISPGYYDESASWISLDSKPLSLIGSGVIPDETNLIAMIAFNRCEGSLLQNLCIRGPSSEVSSAEGLTTLKSCTVRGNDRTPVSTIGSRGMVIEDCVFSGNSGVQGGAVYGGYITVIRSLFVDNHSPSMGGAIDAGWQSSIEQCVFFRNEAPTGAALSFATNVEVRNCTFLGNRVTGPDGGTIQVTDSTYPEPISHCIIAGTVNGYGVACPGSGSLECCDFWDNDGGDLWDWWCDALSERGNIFVDPLLCDVLTGDVGLLPGSPCLPGNHGGMDCGLIGARDLGCGIVATRQVTWGRLKSLYREETR